ncbi:hypothetical protein [Nocardia shimofusensis]|uniref:hypothetical protein n=1 Tax=Nocardia shimofusensis TaxID=228596 RepID=UPI00082F2224|nr:hypothetical protein [Nocardia shimofusensis]
MNQPLHHSPHPERSRRLGIADVAAAYGTEALQRRIAQLHESGQHYAALAIEREIRGATVTEAG